MSSYDDGDRADRADIKALARDLHATAAALEAMLEGLHEVKLTVNTLATRADATNDELKLLSKMLRDGDGINPALTTRLALVESGLKDAHAKLARWEEVREKHNETATIARWTVWASVIGGIISVIGAAVAAVFTIKRG